MEETIKSTRRTGLVNLDTTLSDGFSAKFYVLIGKIGDERNAFLIHLAEYFVLKGENALYFSHYETEKSVLQKIITRCDYKLFRDTTSQLPAIINKLALSTDTL